MVAGLLLVPKAGHTLTKGAVQGTRPDHLVINICTLTRRRSPRSITARDEGSQRITDTIGRTTIAKTGARRE